MAAPPDDISDRRTELETSPRPRPESLDARDARKDATLLTRAEAAEYLSISIKKLDRLAKGGELPSHRIGKRGVRFRREDLDAYVEASRVARDHVEVLRQPGRQTPEVSDHSILRGCEVDDAELAAQARAAGIHQIFKSRVQDAAFKASVSAALADAEADSWVRIMSNSLQFLLLIGPKADTTLSGPMREALRRGVRFQLLLLDPDSPAARTRAGIEQGTTFAADDDAFYESHLYRNIVVATEALGDPNISWLGDEEIQERLQDREQVQVRFSKAEPTTHLLLTEKLCLVENYHSGGDAEIESSLRREGVGGLHCFGGFVPVLLYDNDCLAGRLIQSHFRHSWDAAEDGPTIEAVLDHATVRGVRSWLDATGRA